jgi:hypothetical protein
MSFKLYELVWGIKPGFLTVTEKFVLVRLAGFANEDGSSVYPSIKRVSEETGASISAVQRAIKALLHKNVLFLVKSFTSRKPNSYQIDIGLLKHLAEKIDGMADIKSCQGSQGDYSKHSQGIHSDHPNMHQKSSRVFTVTTQGIHSDYSRVVTVTTDKSYTQSIYSVTLLPISSNRLVADAPLDTPFSDHDGLEEISSTSNPDQDETSLFPPGGCVEGSSSQDQNPEVLKGSSLQGLGIGYSYGISFAKPSLDGGFPSVLNKSPKTCHISGSEGQSLVSIGKSQETSPDDLNGPAIDISSEKRDSDSQKVSSRKKSKKENRGTRVDETMTLDKTKLDIALNQGLHSSWVASELEEFVGYYANPTLPPSKAFHVNWDAAWRNWCKNAILYDRYEKKTKPHPTLSTPSFADVSGSSPSLPVMDAKLQAFVTAHHQLGSNAFAFQSCEVVEHADKIILQVPSRHCLDKVDLYHRELEDHFGKEVEMVVIKAPQPQVVEEKPLITLSETDFLEPRLKAFLEKNIQIDASVHFAFKATTITETADTIVLHNDLAYGLSQVDFYARDLEKFFGKRVEATSKTPPHSLHPQPLQRENQTKAEDETTRKYSPNNNGQVTPRAVLKESLKDFRTTPGVNTFPYRTIGVVLQEARQGVGR